MDITLKHPIKVEGAEVTKITFRRPTVKELKAMDAAEGDIAKVAELIAELAAIPPSSVDQIDAEDFMVISEEVTGFFGAPQKTGKRRSRT